MLGHIPTYGGYVWFPGLKVEHTRAVPGEGKWLGSLEVSLGHGCSKPSLPAGLCEKDSCLSLGPIPGVASYKAESGVLAPSSNSSLSSSRPSAVSKITSWMVGGPWSLVTPSCMDPGAAPSLNRRNAISAYELS